MTPPKQLVVISSEYQLRKVVEANHPLEALQVICDNPKFYADLKKCGIEFEELDEFGLQDQWDQLNQWGCTQACDWIRFTQQKGSFRHIDMASVIYHNFSRLLIHILKNYSYAKKLIERYAPEHVLIITEPMRRKFPHYSGNFFLNYFLKHHASTKGVHITEISVPESIKPEPFYPLYVPWHRKMIRIIGKTIMTTLLRIMSRTHLSGSVIASGSLKHLASTLKGLQQKGRQVAIYDYEFHTEQFFFALKHRMQYFIPACFSKPVLNPQEWVAQRYAEMVRALAEASVEGLFVFDQYHFGDFIRDHIFSSLHDYLFELAQRENLYQNFIQELRPECILTEDDFSNKGAFLAAYCRTKRIPVFCISHANLPIDFQVPLDRCAFSQSVHFVNSQYERDMYSARGWKSEAIVVTGTPRYDRLLRAAQQPRRPFRTKPIKILYCATTLWPHTPDLRGYLGIHISTYAGVQIAIIRSVFEALRDLPVELVIKPHSFEATHSWQEFIKEEGFTNKASVAKHSEDFYQLLLSSRAMILPYSSTARIEAAILGIPTIYVVLAAFNSRTTAEFAKPGFLTIASSPNELRRELKRLSEMPPMLLRPPVSADQVTQYYLGPQDAQNTDRVVAHVIAVLNQPIHNKTPLAAT